MATNSWSLTVSRKFQGSISWVFLGKELPGMWRFGVRFITLKWFLGSGYLISSHVTPVTLFRLCFIIFTKLAVWGPSLKWSTQNSSKVLSGRHFLHPFFTYMRSTSHFMAIALILDLFKLGIYNVLHFTKAWFGSKRLKKGWIRLKIRL